MFGANTKSVQLEPNGHIGLGSKIERYLRDASSAGALLRRRVQAFDEVAGVSYYPMLYGFEPFTLSDEVPSDIWITDELLKFVRDEFQKTTRPEPNFRALSRSVPVIEVNETPFLDIFLNDGEQFDFDSLPSGANRKPDEMAGLIYDILCMPAIGSSKNAETVDRSSFITSLRDTIERRERLLFVLPGLPFKDQNMFRVPHEASDPDLAELAFLIRLHRLTQTIYQVHPFGADVVVLSDGSLYGDHFCVRRELLDRYLRRILSYRDRFGLQGTISILSLKELIDRSSGTQRVAWNVAHSIRQRIERLIAMSDSPLKLSFETLKGGIKWNMNSREMLRELPPEIAWRVLTKQLDEIPASEAHAWNVFDEFANKTALEYVSTNLMLRWTKLIQLSFPGSIRGTVHPKPGQFALSIPGSTSPWNGVAWSQKWPMRLSDVEVRPVMSIAPREGIHLVRFADSGLPCCYTSIA